MANHRNLLVWQRAQALSIAVHLAAQRFPRAGAPGLRGQLLRAIASIPANIAEAVGQGTDAQCVAFLSVAIGSANEAETFLELAAALGYMPPSVSAKLLRELDAVRRMTYGLRKSRSQRSHLPLR